MMSVTSQTRLESYRAIQPHMNKREAEVYDLLAGATQNGYDMTMREIVSALHWKDRCNLTGRIDGLRKKGLIMVSRVRWDSETKRRVTAWKVKG